MQGLGYVLSKGRGGSEAGGAWRVFIVELEGRRWSRRSRSSGSKGVEMDGRVGRWVCLAVSFRRHV